MSATYLLTYSIDKGYIYHAIDDEYLLMSVVVHMDYPMNPTK